MASVKYENKGPVDCTTEIQRSKVKGKTVVITGGANGIGAAYATAMAEAGAHVVIGDIDEAGAAKLKSQFPNNLHFSRCDVTNWDDLVALFDTAIKTSPKGRIDVVVANAGISGQDPVFVDDDLSASVPAKPNLKIVEINLVGVLYTVKLALHNFRRQYNADKTGDTCLVLQGSVSGYLDQPGSPQYNASKFGLRGIMRSLRRTSLQHGTRVNFIGPWYIKTNIMDAQVIERVKSKGVVFAEIEDAGAALLRLASDQNIHGRAFAIVPRTLAPQGHMDFDHDDYPQGDILADLQEIALKASHRLTGPSVNE